MRENFDLVVIGGGPAGYVGAIRAAQLGLKTAIVEKRGAFGGTCLNVGCIPSKAMLQSSYHFELATKEFYSHGIFAEKLRLDLPAMLARKDKVVEDLTKGVEYLLKKNKISIFLGEGRIFAKNEVAVIGEKNKDPQNILKTEKILIATGSEVTPLPNVDIDEKSIVSSTGALSLGKVPKKMVIIGAGVIGLELGSVWKRLGAEVTVVEFLDVVLPGMDNELSKSMENILQKQGLKFKMGAKVTNAKKKKNKVVVKLVDLKSDMEEEIDGDIVLVAIGRSPFFEGLGVRELGVSINELGFIEVDANFQTNVDGVYAVGDVIGGAMLAHKAEEEAAACIEIMAGQSGHVNYNTIPGIVYTHPEVATVGKTEEELRKAGIEFNVGKFPFSANSRARCNADTEGFVKIIAKKVSDEIVGCHIIGAGAGDLIQEVVVAMELSASAEDIARICHGHPGMPEAIKEAALGVGGRAVHL